MADASTDELYGWDTVFAVPIDQINTAIAARKSSPPGFESTDDADSMHASAQFGDWQVTPGGSGPILQLAIPFHDGCFEGKGSSVDGLAGVASATVHLEYVEHQQVKGKQLRVKVTGDDASIPVSAVSFTGPVDHSTGKADVDGVLRPYFACCCNDG